MKEQGISDATSLGLMCNACTARGVFSKYVIVGEEFAEGLMRFQPFDSEVLRLLGLAMFHNRSAASVANRAQNLFRKSAV